MKKIVLLLIAAYSLVAAIALACVASQPLHWLLIALAGTTFAVTVNTVYQMYIKDNFMNINGKAWKIKQLEHATTTEPVKEIVSEYKYNRKQGAVARYVKHSNTFTALQKAAFTYSILKDQALNQ